MLFKIIFFLFFTQTVLLFLSSLFLSLYISLIFTPYLQLPCISPPRSSFYLSVSSVFPPSCHTFSAVAALLALSCIVLPLLSHSFLFFTQNIIWHSIHNSYIPLILPFIYSIYLSHCPLYMSSSVFCAIWKANSSDLIDSLVPNLSESSTTNLTPSTPPTAFHPKSV